MASSIIEQIVGKAITDKAFRDELLADPEKAVSGNGFNLSPAELQNLKDGIEAVKDGDQLQQTFDEYLAGTEGGWQ